MWLILLCGWDGCSGIEDIELARAANWSAEAAIIGFIDPEYPTLRREWFPTEVDGVAETARFRTQRECLAALRRAMPAGERRQTYANSGEGWELEDVTHYRDYVESFQAVGWEEGRANMMRTYSYACFQEAPRIW